MALEKSSLDFDKISELLLKHYDIRVDSAEKMDFGTANCFRISSEDKLYFLKEFQSGFEIGNLIREAALVNYLYEKQIPVARFIFTNDQKEYIVYDGHLICLQEYIVGKTYGYDHFPSRLLKESSGMLAKLHNALRDYPLPTDMGEEWLDSFSSKLLANQYDKLISIAETQSEDINCAKIIADLKYKKTLAIRCEYYKTFYEGITYSPTHGDYQGCQLICGEDNIKAVIDFSSARNLPVVWEIMRAYVQSSKSREDAKIDVCGLCEYVEEYMKYAPLTKKDLVSMPYVYLFQLARSKYGYPQYLSTDSEDREGLLKFAFWRTDICREVEKNAQTISEALLKLE